MRKKTRALSANKSQIIEDPTRPRTRYEKLKTDITENDRDTFYNKRNLLKNSKYNYKSFGKSIFQEPEKIKEENMNLKGFINELQGQLHMQRSVIEMNKKKASKYVKQFNRQFDKQMYYSGKNPNAYMITGIKQQYENIKQIYNQKCNELQMYLKDANLTDLQERNAYIEALEKENLLLKEKIYAFSYQKQSHIDKFYPKSKKKHQSYEQSEVQLKINEELLNEISENKISIQQYKNQLQTLKQKNKSLNNKIAEFHKKIIFLQKLIIQKDNNQYKTRLQSKKLSSIINEHAIDINNLRNQLKNKERQYEKRMSQAIEKQNKKYFIENSIFKKSLNEKNVMVQKLQKEIRYLTTLLSYWKPLDQINREMKRQSINEEEGKEEQPSYNYKQPHKMSQSLLRSQHQSEQVNELVKNGRNQYEKIKRNNTEGGNHLKTKGEAKRTNSNRNVSSSVGQNKIRKLQSCLIKHNDNAKKVRRITPEQIKNYTDLIKYRFIGYHYDINHLRDLFAFKNSSQQQQEQSSQEQFISMKEIKKILVENPFFLNEEGAIAIGRFIVEQGSSQFVYLDENNQIQKVIAISILKNLIGQAKEANNQQIKLQWQNLKNIYLGNIISALKILAPKGLISNIKLIELLVGLGIQMSEQFKDWIIATLVISSESLDQLKYSILFSSSPS